jgi:hypothetical protein
MRIIVMCFLVYIVLILNKIVNITPNYYEEDILWATVSIALILQIRLLECCISWWIYGHLFQTYI